MSTMGPVMESTLPLLISSGMQLAPMSFMSMSRANFTTSLAVLAKARPAWSRKGYKKVMTTSEKIKDIYLGEMPALAL